MRPWRAKARRRPGVMNKTEAAYADHLEMQRLAGEVLWYAYESVTLKLADDCRYTPDFAVVRADMSLEMHEVKGFWRDDARVKIKVAAEKFPFAFIAVTQVPVRQGGGWKFEEF